MDIQKSIELSKTEVDEAIMEYLSIREVTYNVDEIQYVMKSDGETLSRVYVKAR